MNMIKEVNENEAKELISKKEIVIVDFFATWCGPCKMFAPVYEEVSKKFSNLEMIKIDIDKNVEYASKNNVMSIPTIVAFKNGREFSRFLGYKSNEELVEFLQGL